MREHLQAQVREQFGIAPEQIHIRPGLPSMLSMLNTRSCPACTVVPASASVPAGNTAPPRCAHQQCTFAAGLVLRSMLDRQTNNVGFVGGSQPITSPCRRRPCGPWPPRAVCQSASQRAIPWRGVGYWRSRAPPRARHGVPRRVRYVSRRGTTRAAAYDWSDRPPRAPQRRRRLGLDDASASWVRPGR